MKLKELRKWLAIGSGVGVEIRGADLHVLVAKVRPSGVALLGAGTIEGFAHRPAAEWGAEYLGMIRKLGAGHLAANVLLPREEVIVRQIALPGVRDKDLQAAVGYQIEALHPYPEDDVAWTAARAGKTSTVLVGITRKETLDRYLNLFAEAGIKVASFTFSAAVIYSALRLYGDPPAAGFLALHQTGEGVEAYGESAARPVFSAAFPGQAARARTLATSELRLDPASEPSALTDVLPYPKGVSRENAEYRTALDARVLPYAAALAGACPRLSLSVNLLPEELRKSASRLIYVPTVMLAVVLAAMTAAWAFEDTYNRRRYVSALETEIKKLAPQVGRLSPADKSIADARKRVKQLDEFRRRSHDDMEALNELTRILPPPLWLSQLDITRTSINFAGEAEQAAPLIKQVDNSKLFENSEFTMPIARVAGGEAFRIRTFREGLPKEGGAQ